MNFVEILQNCQILQGGKAQIDVPFCMMINLQVVRPALAMDIEKMKADFIHGYRPGAAVFYVSTTNIQGTERSVSDEDRMSWNAHWRRKNVEFEESSMLIWSCASSPTRCFMCTMVTTDL